MLQSECQQASLDSVPATMLMQYKWFFTECHGNDWDELFLQMMLDREEIVLINFAAVRNV